MFCRSFFAYVSAYVFLASSLWAVGCSDSAGNTPADSATAGGGSDAGGPGADASAAPEPDGGQPVRPPGNMVSDAGSNSANRDAPLVSETLPPLISAEQACQMASEARCKKLNGCAPFLLGVLFGTVKECTARFALTCLDELEAGQTGLNRTNLVMCAQSVERVACGDFLSRKGIDACYPRGGRTNGAACSVHSQCDSGYCHPTRSCGVCGARMPLGGKCTQDEQCVAGQICSDAGACVEPGAAGAKCSPKEAPCEGPLACVDGKCQTPRLAGTRCEGSDECDDLSGNFCDQAPGGGAKICQPVKIALPNESCGYVNNVYTVCTGGFDSALSLCHAPATGAAPTCAPPAKEGEACGAATTDNRPCVIPAFCVEGQCRIFSAKLCN